MKIFFLIRFFVFKNDDIVFFSAENGVRYGAAIFAVICDRIEKFILIVLAVRFEILINDRIPKDEESLFFDLDVNVCVLGAFIAEIADGDARIASIGKAEFGRRLQGVGVLDF